MSIDALAHVHPDAEVDEDVDIGPFTVIGPHVRIASGCRIGPHVVISGHTTLGRDNHVYQFASLGAEPQHRAYKGEPTRLEVGDRNTFREYVSVHRGTMLDAGTTIIGHDNLLMAYVHIAHDCVLGNGITMANNVTLAGHVRMGDHCVCGGFAMVYQFRQVGKVSFLAYCTGAEHDVPAFSRCFGGPARARGINSIGMRNHGYSEADIAAVKKAYRTLYRSKLRLVQAREQLREPARHNAAVAELLVSLDAVKHGIIR